LRYQNTSDLLSDLKESQLFILTGKPLKKTINIHPIKFFTKKVSIIPVLTTFLIVVFILLLSWNTIKNWIGLESVPSEKHMAILPFALIGDDKSNKAFCDGLFETLISKLGQLENYQKALWVVPVAEIRKHNVQSPSEVGKKFKKVRLAVSGSVQFDRDELRLTMNLIETKEMRQIESRVRNYQFASLFRLQDDIVIQLV